MKPPVFWHDNSYPNKIFSCILSPLGWLYGAIVQARLKWRCSTKVSVPVICIGNITMGGTGKTPSVIYLVGVLRNLGYTPHILTRGYGGNLDGIVQVDPETHTPSQVGDEPLLLARHAPVWRGRDRVAAAHQAIAAGATIIIMDDGLQNPSLHKDISLAIFDGISQVGNGQVFPAGPLRQSLKSGLSLIDGAFLLNFDTNEFQVELAKLCVEKKIGDMPHFPGKVQTEARPIKEQKYLAFAGIGVPEKFFKTLQEQKYAVTRAIPYPDHHIYTQEDLQYLATIAKKENLRLITTEKDAIKLTPSFLEQVDIVKIKLSFIHEKEIIEWFEEKLRGGSCLGDCK